MGTKMKLSAVALAAACAAATLGYVQLRPWLAAPPAPDAEIDANWATVVALAERDAACGGDASSWLAMHESIRALSADTVGLIQERYDEALPLPLEAMPQDALDALDTGLSWVAQGGAYVAGEGDALGVHRLGQLLAIVETAPTDLDRLGVRLATSAMRCGALVDFAVGVSIAEDAVARESEGADAFDLGPGGLSAVLAREAVGTLAMIDDNLAGSSDLSALDDAMPSLLSVSLGRERRMVQWYWGARIANATSASTAAEAAERLLAEPDRRGLRSPLLEIVAIQPTGVFEDYLALLED